MDESQTSNTFFFLCLVGYLSIIIEIKRNTMLKLHSCFLILIICIVATSIRGESPQDDVTITEAPVTANPAAASEQPSVQPFLTRAPVEPTLPFTRRPRCGTSWMDANDHCHGFCQTDEDCFQQNRDHPFCFGDLTNLCQLQSLSRCGRYWEDANQNCHAACSDSNTNCPSGMACYSDVSDICDARCGSSWDAANNQCANQCRTLDKIDCPRGEQCFRDMTKFCSKALSGATSTALLLSQGMMISLVSILWLALS